MLKSLYDIEKFKVTSPNMVPKSSHFQVVVFTTQSVYIPEGGHSYPAYTETYQIPKIYCTGDKTNWQDIVSLLLKEKPNRTDMIAFFVQGVADIKVSIELDLNR